MIDIGSCLSRIKYSGSVEPCLNTLTDLQQSFLLTVPFENLDIHLGREITLSPENIYKKIILHKRGGFCYECNFLFHNLLTALGFSVAIVSARMQLETSLGEEYDHMVLLVNLDHDYLVDVGNGQSCREPLRLDGANMVVNEDIAYTIERRDHVYSLNYRSAGKDWASRFLFAPVPRQIHEFADMCEYQQTSEHSHFTRNRITTIATRDGRVSLKDRELTITTKNDMVQREITDRDDYQQILYRKFGIRLENIPETW